jgi:ABC-type transport system involved in cytochrome bd biosynthesis fused ATPase/permease subunit
MTSLEELRKQAEQGLRGDEKKNRSFESEEAKNRLIQALEKTLVAWRARKHRLRRFVRLREKLEIVLIGSLVSVASVASLQSIFGAAQALVMKALLVVTGLVGAVDLVLMAIDPFRRTKLYHARVQKMISAFEDYQRQVILLDPSLQQMQRIAMLAESAYQLLRPQDEDWP